jgi:cytochrome b561/polyisoprenoid-binding protein YceI
MTTTEAPRSQPAPDRYTSVAIALHWIIALGILFMIPLGFWMHRAITNPALSQTTFAAFQLHKSIGLTILALSLVRLAWRLGHKPPPLNPEMPAWEKFAAHATHWLFYVLIIAMPLTGWLYVSTDWSAPYDRVFAIPTLWFGLVQIPDLPGFANASVETRRTAGEAAFNAHAFLAFGALALIALHVAAALKHHFINKDETLANMVPPARGNMIVASLVGAFAACAFLAAGWAITSPITKRPAIVAAAETSAAPAPEAAAVASATPIAAPSVVAPKQAAAAPTGGPPAAWKIDAAQSKISFAAASSGGNVTGSFGKWTADIKFSPDNLPASKAVVTIQTSTAVTSVPEFTAYLPDDTWFGFGKFPNATYTTSAIRSLGGDKYEADGTLTIKDKSAPLKLPFTLKMAGNVATMNGSASIERLAYDFGKGTAKSAAEEEYWLAPRITVTINVRATK